MPWIDTSRLFVVQRCREQAADGSICLAKKYPSPEDRDAVTNNNVVSWFSKGNGCGAVVYCRKHIHLFKKSLAGTRLFVMANTPSSEVIE